MEVGVVDPEDQAKPKKWEMVEKVWAGILFPSELKELKQKMTIVALHDNDLDWIREDGIVVLGEDHIRLVYGKPEGANLQRTGDQLVIFINDIDIHNLKKEGRIEWEDILLILDTKIED